MYIFWYIYTLMYVCINTLYVHIATYIAMAIGYLILSSRLRMHMYIRTCIHKYIRTLHTYMHT